MYIEPIAFDRSCCVLLKVKTRKKIKCLFWNLEVKFLFLGGYTYVLPPRSQNIVPNMRAIPIVNRNLTAV